MAKKAWASFRVWGTGVAVLLLVAGAALLVWGDVRQFREENRRSVHQTLVRDAAIQVEHELIDQHDRAAADLAGCEIVRQVLAGNTSPDGPAMRAALATARRLTGATQILFVDEKGIVSANDHVDGSHAIVGGNLSSYAYVRECLSGRPMLHVGVGDLPGVPGIYHAVAARVSPDASPGGAIILKMEAPQVAEALGHLSIPVALQAPDGTFLGCNRSEWLAAPASEPLASVDGAPNQVASTPGNPIVSLPFDPKGERATINGSTHLLVRQPVGDSGWTLLALLDVSNAPPLTAAQQRHVITRAVVLVLAGLMIIMLTALVLKGSQLEASLRQSHARIESANRAKDGFLALLSHELRTPLTPVLARVSLLEREEGLTPSMREAVIMIRRNVETEARLIDDLLDLTRADSGKLTLDQEVVDVHALAGHVASMFEDEAREKQIELSTELRATRHHIKGDSHRLQQVLWNLASNAIKFTPAGGKVRVIVSNEGAAGDTLRIDVSDTGKGIDPDICNRLFAPFEQGGGEVTREFGGLGLGLAICKTLVHAHHGTLSASSDGLGHGATFSIRLAALDLASIPTAQPHRSSEAAALPIRSTPMRILLVEDHADTRRVLERLLQDMGHTVTAAAGMLDALEAARTTDFDLVLSDLGLPDGSGTDLLQQLRKNGNVNLRAVSISGYGSESDIASSRAAGFTAHLTKPVRVEQIEQVLAAPQSNH